MKFQWAWSNLGAPRQICKLLSGARIPFRQKPPLIFPNSVIMRNYRTKTSCSMTTQIQNMLESGILEHAERSPSYLSTFFLIPKSDGSQRPILNLKQLNYFVITKSFQPFSYTNFSTTQRLDGKGRFEPSIFSRAYCSTSSQIPEAKLSSRSRPAPTASDDLFALQTFFSTKDICLLDQLGCKVSQEPRNQVCSLFG